jgi:hypothetical protein
VLLALDCYPEAQICSHKEDLTVSQIIFSPSNLSPDTGKKNILQKKKLKTFVY